ncbi:MAG: hypothetical protein JWM17_1906, partial [Actinobacteria bacterium]|nr:hypothetical protein [Actinomycetota bacterium]
LNGMEVRQLLTDSARPLGRAGFNSETGHGLLDVEAALHRLDQALASPTPPGRAL